MPPVVINNPIIDSPFDKPSRYFELDDDGITDRIAEGHRSNLSGQVLTGGENLTSPLLPA